MAREIEVTLPNGSTGDVRQLMWDNSVCGSSVTLRGSVTATLDDEGRHHFRALSEIARLDSKHMQAVLDVVLGAPITR